LANVLEQAEGHRLIMTPFGDCVIDKNTTQSEWLEILDTVACGKDSYEGGCTELGFEFRPISHAAAERVIPTPDGECISNDFVCEDDYWELQCDPYLFTSSKPDWYSACAFLGYELVRAGPHVTKAIPLPDGRNCWITRPIDWNGWNAVTIELQEKDPVKFLEHKSRGGISKCANLGFSLKKPKRVDDGPVSWDFMFLDSHQMTS
jgi:hypothetical protein